jgi:hypothetical protein
VGSLATRVNFWISSILKPVNSAMISIDNPTLSKFLAITIFSLASPLASAAYNSSLSL